MMENTVYKLFTCLMVEMFFLYHKINNVDENFPTDPVITRLRISEDLCYVILKTFYKVQSKVKAVTHALDMSVFVKLNKQN